MICITALQYTHPYSIIVKYYIKNMKEKKISLEYGNSKISQPLKSGNMTTNKKLIAREF